jgi:PAS domain S-box-containing protein
MDERLDTAPCGFLSFADDGAITSINLTLAELLGYEKDELVGRHVEQVLTVGSRIFYQTHWFPLLRLHGSAEEIFLMLRTKSKEEVGALFNAVRRERGGDVEYDCVVMRVRERQKYEDQLLRARRKAEQAHAELEVRQAELQQANEQLEAQAVELEAQAVELEFQQQQLHEQAAELEAASEELQAINDHLLARTEEAEHLRAAAEEANHAKSAFLAVMSHELRTPLNAIGGYAQIMSMGIQGPVTTSQLESLDRIDRSQRHLLRLINEVLNLARIEAGHIDYAVDDVPVDELVAAVTPMVEPQLESKGIGFAVDLTPDLAVRADRDKAQQILLNLLSNAAKFTPGGGSVRLEAARSDERRSQVVLRVRDSGIGIPPDKLGAIFEPFVQVDASRTRGQEGTGLGLAISRDLARGMKGDLTAESTPGEGSTFLLHLPMA